ncbi:MAG: 2-oxo acid dehydrogenase subunit E2 [Bacteroidetes bacterium]|nr:2-oxo acid dehydrogenase subunit E2 [Bacteroidota bacterium]
MAEAIRMPLLSDTMKEGVIAAWHKKVGDKIKSDDVLADVETDKATMEVMPYVDGTLLYVGVEKGKAAKVNDIIAIIGKEGEDYSSLLDSNTTTSSAATDTQAPVASTASTTLPKPGDATVIRMPLLSDTMKEGKIVAWHKQIGDKIKSDDVLADVETDKATMEVMPYVDGILLYVGVETGEAAKVNDIIAIVGKAGTDISPYLTSSSQTSTDNSTAAAASGATPVVANNNALNQEAQKDTDRLKASPLARKLALDKGIDIHQIKGSGDNGRIIKRDVDNYQPNSTTVSDTKSIVSTPFATATIGQERYTDIPLTQMRKVIAQRLAESKFSAPHFYLRMSVTMDNAASARKAINDISPVKVSFNDLIIKAVAMSLRKHPSVNSSWMNDFVRQNEHVHIGTAVAIEDGLIVPVIKFADQKSLAQIAGEAKSLVEKARTKKLQPPEFTGNTFTISNLGMMDIDEFTAIINPPDSCILAVGKISPTPVVEEGQVVVRQILKLTLSCDHRTVDGAVGAAFLQTLKSFLENPVTMLV